MLTYTKVVNYAPAAPKQGASGAYTPGTRYVEGVCLSTDTKPTSDIENGSSLIEMDSGKLYFYDAESGDWVEWGA